MTYKLYGRPEKIILHGGPGAPGSVSSLARDLDNCIELHNSGQSIKEQLDEIQTLVTEFDMKNPVLIGHSWGAWLAYIYAAKYTCSKIALIGCGAFKDDYLNVMTHKRQEKLSDKELKLVDRYFYKFNHNISCDMKIFGHLMAKMDSYDILDYEDEVFDFDIKGHHLLMKELRGLRSSNALIEMSKSISCEVVVVHGKEDPHPFSGVIEPFKAASLVHKTYLLDKCGHTPWQERFAKDAFYKIMLEEF